MLTCRTTPNQEENLLPRAAKVKVRVVWDVVREEELEVREEGMLAMEEERAAEEEALQLLLEAEKFNTARNRENHSPVSGARSPVTVFICVTK